MAAGLALILRGLREPAIMHGLFWFSQHNRRQRWGHLQWQLGI